MDSAAATALAKALSLILIVPSRPMSSGRCCFRSSVRAYMRERHMETCRREKRLRYTGATSLMTQQVTELLLAWGEGDQAALEQLIPLVHAELRRIAARYMARERAGHTLQPTALVNEVYVRLVDVERVKWQNRAHFLAVSSRLMRRILVDFARTRSYKKRGAGARHVPFDDTAIIDIGRGHDVLALDDALDVLARINARQSQIVVMRFFGGLTNDEIASALDISAATVMRDWQLAKTWLLRELDRTRTGSRSMSSLPMPLRASSRRPRSRHSRAGPCTPSCGSRAQPTPWAISGFRAVPMPLSSHPPRLISSPSSRMAPPTTCCRRSASRANVRCSSHRR